MTLRTTGIHNKEMSSQEAVLTSHSKERLKQTVETDWLFHTNQLTITRLSVCQEPNRLEGECSNHPFLFGESNCID